MSQKCPNCTKPFLISPSKEKPYMKLCIACGFEWMPVLYSEVQIQNLIKTGKLTEKSLWDDYYLTTDKEQWKLQKDGFIPTKIEGIHK